MSLLLKAHLALAICLQFFATISVDAKVVYCYWGTWSHYRQGDGKFQVGNIDPKLCTHLAYAFFGMTDQGAIKLMDSWLDVDLKNIEKTIALKQQNRNLKVIASIGGWNEGSTKYSAMAGDARKRSTFITTTMSLVQKYGFDGVDLDWEYPAQRGGSAADIQNYVTLLRELNAALKAQGKLLSVAVAAPQTSASKSYDIRGMAQHLDFINLMTYDLHGSWDNVLGHNAPLQGAGPLTVSASINYWLSQGAPASKIVVGIPFYGRSFTMANPSQNRVGAPSSGPGTAGALTREAGFLGYNEICPTLNSWRQEWDNGAMAPFAYQGNQWVGYDNVRSINDKMNFIKQHNLAGAMAWSIETDDFLGRCGSRYPLLQAMNNGLGGGSSSTSTGSIPAPQAPPRAPPANNSGSQSNAICSADGYFRDGNDCARFYSCSAGRRYDFVCPAGLHFDTRIRSCNWPSEANCQG